MNGAVFQGDDAVLSTAAVQGCSVLNQRRNQQDAFAVTGPLAAVADGLGGHERGEEASRAALEALVGAVPGPCDLDDLLAGVDAAQAAVVALADGVYRNPGTTLVAVAVSDDGCVVHGAWSGDSRAWLLTDGEPAVSLTLDHAFAVGGLWSCLGDHGDSASFRVDTFTVEVGRGHKLLLTTDGAHGWLGTSNGRVSSGELATLAAAGVVDLVEAAAERGTDNVTAVLIDVDSWAAGVTPARSPRRWRVNRRRQGGEWSAWIEGLTAPAVGSTREAADRALAQALLRWAATDPGGPHADLAAEVATCADLDEVLELIT